MVHSLVETMDSCHVLMLLAFDGYMMNTYMPMSSLLAIVKRLKIMNVIACPCLHMLRRLDMEKSSMHFKCVRMYLHKLR
jgi:hypothetical protein